MLGTMTAHGPTKSNASNVKPTLLEERDYRCKKETVNKMEQASSYSEKPVFERFVLHEPNPIRIHGSGSWTGAGPSGATTKSRRQYARDLQTCVMIRNTGCQTIVRWEIFLKRCSRAFSRKRKGIILLPQTAFLICHRGCSRP
jgi:hypothetical protein